jgi:hypothetical protein
LVILLGLALNSFDSPAFSSQVAGIADVYHHAQLNAIFLEVLFLFVCLFVYETGSCYVAQPGLELTNLLPQILNNVFQKMLPIITALSLTLK